MHIVQPEQEEYHVLLQNLPKAVLNESNLRKMVKEAKLQDVKKLAFRSDGRALITLTKYGALRQCINHFNGLPWFHAPMCSVPAVIATQAFSHSLMQKAISGKSPVKRGSQCIERQATKTNQQTHPWFHQALLQSCRQTHLLLCQVQ